DDFVGADMEIVESHSDRKSSERRRTRDVEHSERYGYVVRWADSADDRYPAVPSEVPPGEDVANPRKVEGASRSRSRERRASRREGCAVLLGGVELPAHPVHVEGRTANHQAHPDAV